jgi:3-hydroxybutyryl-CoA dehydrogenase
MSALPRDTVVAVLGAGTMGAGIAHVAAEAGHRVLLFDTNQEVIVSALQSLQQRLDRSVATGRRSAEQAAALVSRISPAAALAELADAGLVIEAIIEDLGIKQRVFAELEDIVAADAVLATNTSSLSVTAIAAPLRDPRRVVGMHFFNPAPVMPLVEIVVGADTAPDVTDAAIATAAAWGKTAVRCTSTPGFIVNRVARPFYSESLRILDEGVADIATIDAIVTGSGGFRMGPFTLMDLVGLDVNLAVSTSVYEQSFHDPRFAPHLRQRAKVDAGHLGRKTGRGWYDYADGAPVVEPATLPQGPHPDLVLADEGPLLDDVVTRLEAGGVTVVRTDLPFFLEVDGVQIFPTDGRPAAMLMLDPDLPDRVTLDLVLDWSTAERVAISAPSSVADASIAKAAGVFQAAGLMVSRVDDVPGMVMARILAQLVSVAADAATAGVAAPEDIDTAMRLGTNYPGGPFEWADTLGVTRIQMVLDHLRWFYGEDRYRMAPAVRRAVFAGVPLRKQAARSG